MILIIFASVLISSISKDDCYNPGLAFCQVNLMLEDQSGPVCDIVDFEGCQEQFDDLTVEAWTDEVYETIACHCEKPEVIKFLKTEATAPIILFDQFAHEYQNDYAVSDRRALSWDFWLQFSTSTVLSVVGIIATVAMGRRELGEGLVFDFNEIFHPCAAIDVPTSFCSQLMSDNTFEFSQLCGKDLECSLDYEGVMSVMQDAQSTSLDQMPSHEECPDFGLGFCYLNTILTGKTGSICDNLVEDVVDCEETFGKMSVEDFINFYENNNMNCFCSRPEVQVELVKHRPDVMIFDMVVASSHNVHNAVSRRALAGGCDWMCWTSFIVGIVGSVAGAVAPFVGRRALEANAVALTTQISWPDIVDVCSQNSPFEMCEMPASLVVKQFEFLCLGEGECAVQSKDILRLIRSNIEQ